MKTIHLVWTVLLIAYAAGSLIGVSWPNNPFTSGLWWTGVALMTVNGVLTGMIRERLENEK